MKMTWLAMLLAFLMPIALIAQNDINNKPAKKEKVFSNEFGALKKVEKQSNSSRNTVSTPSEKPTALRTAPQRTSKSFASPSIRDKSHHPQPSTEAYQFIGLDPEKSTIADYINAKVQLKKANFEKYKELVTLERKTVTTTPRKAQISRARFNQLSPERQAKIKAHPERYEIKD